MISDIIDYPQNLRKIDFYQEPLKWLGIDPLRYKTRQ